MPRIRNKWAGVRPDQVVNVVAAGSYEIAPLELDLSQALAPQVLKVAKPDTGEYYYLSYRQPIGFDANLSSSLTSRVQIHTYQGNGGRTWYLRGLLEGETFVDDVNGVTITHGQHTPDTASVQVAFDTECLTGPSQVALTPSNQSAPGGTTLAYDLSVTSTDSISCPQSTFDLLHSLPSGWTGTVSPSTLTVQPGQSAQATLSVTSPASAGAGAYGISVDAHDPSEPLHAGSATATYRVTTACVPDTPQLTLSPSSQSGGAGATVTFGVTLTNTDSADCLDGTFTLGRSVPNGWTGSVSPSSFTLGPGESGMATFSVTSAQNAGQGFYSVAVDSADSSEPTHSVSDSALYEVLAVADTEPPAAPDGLTASVKRKQVNLTWNAVSDNVAVTGYEVWRDGALLATTTETSYNDRDIVSRGEPHVRGRRPRCGGQCLGPEQQRHGRQRGRKRRPQGRWQGEQEVVPVDAVAWNLREWRPYSCGRLSEVIPPAKKRPGMCRAQWVTA